MDAGIRCLLGETYLGVANGDWEDGGRPTTFKNFSIMLLVFTLPTWKALGLDVTWKEATSKRLHFTCPVPCRIAARLVVPRVLASGNLKKWAIAELDR